MTDINAAIGLAQLKKLPRFNRIRIANASNFTKNLAKITTLAVPFVPKGVVHVFHQYTIKLDSAIDRQGIVEALEKQKIGAGIYYPIPIHKQKVYSSLGYKDKLPVSEKVAKSVVSLPIHPYLTKTELRKIVSVISSIL